MLDKFFPAMGQSAKAILVDKVQATKNPDVLKGKAILPGTDHETKVLIYLYLQGANLDMRLISAYCPHQGYDLTKEQLKNDGNIYCSLHRRPICIYSEHNQAYKVEKRGEDYYICQTKQ
ncbi:Rieske 2Fe-2S domain-containing protein [Catenovulum sp. SM1970]|uniref:Rieske 2Fe-2S domain-containing protein n=1 Tax=Marinifaba aquimaris TaxID=2741323 RepID=UPI001574CFA0|nr:Rieske 2Fe-2S domain-containing protein [Marinifaba aquimaris]NTS78102.1 Rieske 2Fe-2S domain-containing protein [Marinifaba aquimaris]